MVSVFGSSGFVGSYYTQRYSSVPIDRNSLVPTSTDILYLISTTDNYNVFTNPYIDIETNLTHLIRVLENCKGKDVTFNFASSWFVYGQVQIPADETAYCDPKGFYSITKRAAEQLLISYCETYNINYRILRFANVLGPNDKHVSKKKNALTFLIQELIKGNDISLYDNGMFYRDYIHVHDLCTAINLVIENGEKNTIYNIGNGVPILFKDVIDYAKIKINSKSQINTIEQSDFHKVVQSKSFYMNCEKLFNLGYKPKYTIEQIIDELIETYK